MENFGFNQGSIARRLLLQMVAISPLATAIIGALQIHFRHREKFRSIDDGLLRIEISHRKNLSEQLVHFDEDLLRAELHSIMTAPEIQFVEVRNAIVVQESLKASLAEKEPLLKEVHHRVINNLQIISSLLKLQGRNAKSPELIEFLRDTQNRVRSMALLHETLYRSGDFAKISFPQYVKGICAHLAHSYAGDGLGIRLRQDIADVILDMDQAIPAGLTLVRNLSRQLDGQLSIACEQGSVFEIVFPAQAG